jgi:hypothetical protein
MLDREGYDNRWFEREYLDQKWIKRIKAKMDEKERLGKEFDDGEATGEACGEIGIGAAGGAYGEVCKVGAVVAEINVTDECCEEDYPKALCV